MTRALPRRWGKGRSRAAAKRRTRRTGRPLDSLSAGLLECYPHGKIVPPALLALLRAVGAAK